ncbi:hypothetical protein CPA46_11470 [Sphingopyxis terrae subsp. ummariensis]|nr:hypothetical protein CPA46_11470 [Sphingopyxis terrae subsp. ummariensis]
MQASIGAPFVWGFAGGEGDTHFGDRETMRAHLAPMLDSVERPFLRLQIANFCEDSVRQVAAWKAAYRALAERAPRSAAAWRDVVVVPEQMRLAVEEAILQHGLDAGDAPLERVVAVDVEKGRLGLRLSSALYAQFVQHKGARDTLERAAEPVRAAFGFPDKAVSIAGAEQPPEESAAQKPAGDGFAIIAIGGATRVLSQFAPEASRPSRGGYGYDYGIAYGQAREPQFEPGPPQMRLFQEHAGGKGVGDFDFDGIASIDTRCTYVFVVFEIGNEDVMAAAQRAARNSQAHGRFVIAAILNLPDEDDRSGELVESIFRSLDNYFDTIWVVSDRSAHTRESLPYGPPESMAAASRNFGHLISRARRSDAASLLLRNDRHPAEVNLIASATGDQSLPTLGGHALARLRHYLFEFETVGKVRLEADVRRNEFDPAATALLRAEFPDADINIVPWAHRGGLSTAVIALHGAMLRPATGDRFESYCMDLLERHGWASWYSEQADDLVVTNGKLRDIKLERKFLIGEAGQRALRVRSRRRSLDDEILLTNAPIGRRAFAVQTLGGIVPVHYSRIAAMDRIYRRRYDYVLAFLSKVGLPLETLTVPPAIDWINLQPVVASEGFGKAEKCSDRRTDFELGSKVLRLTIPLRFKRSAETYALGRAIMTLDDGGWHLEHVEVIGDGADNA